jgi:transcriptional regulator with XRE-family HTH domain
MRTKAKLSQAELARRVKMSRGSIANIESGRQHPPLETLWVIAGALGLEPRQLIPSRADLVDGVEPSLPKSDQLESEVSKPLKELNLAGTKAHRWVAEALQELRSLPLEKGGTDDDSSESGEESRESARRVGHRRSTRRS